MRKEKFNFHFPPILRKLKRKAQIILPKDLGIIVAFTGMNKDSIVIDAGTGSGFSSIFFATIAKKIITYEIRKDFADFARKNIKRSGLSNITLREKNIFDGIREKTDIIFLDLPNPENIFSSNFKLKENGFIASYLPNIEQVKEFVIKAERNNFSSFTIEVLARDMLVREFGVRPASKGITHTGYLTFAQEKNAQEKNAQEKNAQEKNKKE